MHYVIWLDVEAGVASGKTTLIERVATRLPWRVVKCKEPVWKWVAGGHLAAFYRSMEECGGRDGTAASFQAMTFATRAEEFSQAIAAAEAAEPGEDVVVIISERSVYADRAMFAEMLVRDGAIAPHLYAMYLETWRSWNAIVGNRRPDVVLWLNTPVEEAYRRYEERGREGERFPLEYARTLHARHVELLANRKRAGDELGGGVLLEVDGTPNFRDSDAAAQAIVDQIVTRVRAVLGDKKTGRVRDT
jgi:deoxyadenosine/deoxycytidine kinase